MAVDLEVLNSEEHAGLRVRETGLPSPHFVQIVASEFATAAIVCPILFTKNPQTGTFFVGAMFGFKSGENLLRGTEDEPQFIPLDRQREGFYIADDNMVIDRSSPRFDDAEGAPLFESDGHPAQALRQMQRALSALSIGMTQTTEFIDTLLRHKLLEPFEATLRFDDGETLVLQGLYTISLDKLYDLSDENVLSLFRAGHMQLIFAQSASIRHVSRLAERRNRKMGEMA